MKETSTMNQCNITLSKPEPPGLENPDLKFGHYSVGAVLKLAPTKRKKSHIINIFETANIKMPGRGWKTPAIVCKVNQCNIILSQRDDIQMKSI
jgi:hypothetical protein